MIAKFSRIGGLFGVALLLLLTVLLPVFSVGGGAGTAYASGEQYLFYYSKDDADAIKQAFSSSPFGPSVSGSTFGDTTVYAKGGVFGSTPFPFTFSQTAASVSPTPLANGAISLEYDSNASLDCAVSSPQPNAPSSLPPPSNGHPYHLSIPMSITIQLQESDIITGTGQGHATVAGTLSFDQSGTTLTSEGSIAANEFGDPGTPIAISDVLNNDVNSFNPAPLSGVMPQSCLPSGVNLNSGSSGPGAIPLRNYLSLSDAAQKNWPGLQSSNAIIIANNSANNPPAGGGGGGGDKQVGCEFQLTNPLTWLICPAVDLMTKFINAYDGLITDQLNIKTNDIFCNTGATTGTCNAYYSAWKAFRDIGLGLMAAVGLIIVIAQALGLEILDAYTVRKVLPRLLLAALGIAVSWPLMSFLIQFSDDLGFGVRHLIYAPFAHLSGISNNLSFGNGAANFFFGAGGDLLGGVALWIEFGGLGALILFALTAALAVAVAVATLILRQVLIILMMLLAPIAIISYVLPNTQRVYRLWWESFSKAMLMFPLIAAMIATGRVFAAIAFHSGTFFSQIIGFIAYFAPYFLIPTTFRLAGGALSAMGGFINSRAQGSFNALSKKRAEVREGRHKAARRSGLYRPGLVPFKYPTLRRAKDEYGNRTGSFWREGSVDKFLNTIGDYTIDAQDKWRVAAGTKLGPLGRAVMGRQARGILAQIGQEQLQNTGEALKRTNMRYHGHRAEAGRFGYFEQGLLNHDLKNGTAYYTGRGRNRRLVLAEGSQLGAMRSKFAKKNKDGSIVRDRKGRVKYGAPRNEKELHDAADILQFGNQGGREAATDLRAKAIEITSRRGAGKEETQRTDTRLEGMMGSAQQGRLENYEIADYYNDMAMEVGHEEATRRTEAIQDAAANLRTSQKKGYGLAYRPKINPETGKQVTDRFGKGVMEAYDAYDEQGPTSAEAQTSIGRITSQDIQNSKSEDILDVEDGGISMYGLALFAKASPVKMLSVQDPKRPGKWKLEQAKDDRGRPVPKQGKEALDAMAMRDELGTIQLYSGGDVGVGGAIYRLMNMAGIPPVKRGAMQSPDMLAGGGGEPPPEEPPPA